MATVLCSPSPGISTLHAVLPPSWMLSGGLSEADPTENTLLVRPPPLKNFPSITTMRMPFVLGSHRHTEPVASATMPLVE